MPLRLADIHEFPVGAVGPWRNELLEPRRGVMAHYDASLSDAGAWRFLRSPECKVSYNWLVLDDGTSVIVAPRSARARHAGKCRPAEGTVPYRDANSAFYGIAFAASPGDRITDKQAQTWVGIAAGLARAHGWTAATVNAWLTDHAREAWPRGRKHDVSGPKGGLLGITLETLREAVAFELERSA